MISSPDAAAIDGLADRLRPHYARFLEAAGDDVLLTGHSHQAWPDVSREGQIAAWDDAARLVDGKWDRVFGEILPEFQRRVASRLGTARAADIAYGQNTHELVYRLSSCFPRDATVLTTDGEFHSLERQLERWAESGTRVIRVPIEDDQGDASTFTARFLEAAERDRPAWAALSYVLFATSRLIIDLPAILAGLARRSIPVLVDAYHAFNALELEVDRWPGEVYVVGGGYKYAECGEGACFMLLAPGARDLRPENTGWFSHHERVLGAHPRPDPGTRPPVQYGGGGLRFLGATFDPTSLYRAVWTLRFMDEMGLSPKVLRTQSLLQTGAIIAAFDALGLERCELRLRTPREARGAFISFASARAAALSAALRRSGIRTDFRGDMVRFGPAPYVKSRDINRAMEALATHAAEQAR